MRFVVRLVYGRLVTVFYQAYRSRMKSHFAGLRHTRDASGLKRKKERKKIADKSIFWELDHFFL